MWLSERTKKLFPWLAFLTARPSGSQPSPAVGQRSPPYGRWRWSRYRLPQERCLRYGLLVPWRCNQNVSAALFVLIADPIALSAPIGRDVCGTTRRSAGQVRLKNGSKSAAEPTRYRCYRIGRGVDGMLYNNVETDKCKVSKITFGNIPSNTVGINNAIKTLNSLLVTSCITSK